MAYTGFPIVTTSLPYAPNFQDLPVTGGGGAWQFVDQVEVTTAGTNTRMDITMPTPTSRKMYRMYIYATVDSTYSIVSPELDNVPRGSTWYLYSGNATTTEMIWSSLGDLSTIASAYCCARYIINHTPTAISTYNNVYYPSTVGSTAALFSLKILTAGIYFGVGSKIILYETTTS